MIDNWRQLGLTKMFVLIKIARWKWLESIRYRLWNTCWWCLISCTVRQVSRRIGRFLGIGTHHYPERRFQVKIRIFGTRLFQWWCVFDTDLNLLGAASPWSSSCWTGYKWQQHTAKTPNIPPIPLIYALRDSGRCNFWGNPLFPSLQKPIKITTLSEDRWYWSFWRGGESSWAG